MKATFLRFQFRTLSNFGMSARDLPKPEAGSAFQAMKQIVARAWFNGSVLFCQSSQPRMASGGSLLSCTPYGACKFMTRA